MCVTSKGRYTRTYCILHVCTAEQCNRIANQPVFSRQNQFFLTSKTFFLFYLYKKKKKNEYSVVSVYNEHRRRIKFSRVRETIVY